MKVKIFSGYVDRMERELNDFLENPKIKIEDIKCTTNDTVYVFYEFKEEVKNEQV